MTKEVPQQIGHDPIAEWKKDSVLHDQQYWRNMYQTGELSPYKKDRAPVKFDAVRDATYEAITEPVKAIKNIGKHIRAIDIDFRGGVDIGDTKVRLQRMAIMVGNIVPFLAFDIATSIPSGLIFEYVDPRMKVDAQNIPADGQKFHPERVKNSVWSSAKKIIEVQNDKVVTALGDMWVYRLTGEKGAWVHEAADKSADFGQTAAEDYLKDVINGPVLESAARFVFQIPVAGALFEQFWTRLSGLQERSQLNKGIAKSFYMGAGTLIYVLRGLKHQTADNKKRAISAEISYWLWKQMNIK